MAKGGPKKKFCSSFTNVKFANIFSATHLSERVSILKTTTPPTSKSVKQRKNHHPPSVRKCQKIENHQHLNYPPASRQTCRNQAGPEEYRTHVRIIHPCNRWLVAKGGPENQICTSCQINLPIFPQPLTSVSKSQ